MPLPHRCPERRGAALALPSWGAVEPQGSVRCYQPVLGSQPAPGPSNKPRRSKRPTGTQGCCGGRGTNAPLSSSAPSPSPTSAVSATALRSWCRWFPGLPGENARPGSAQASVLWGCAFGAEGGTSTCTRRVGITRPGERQQFLSSISSPKASGPSPCLCAGKRQRTLKYHCWGTPETHGLDKNRGAERGIDSPSVMPGVEAISAF